MPGVHDVVLKIERLNKSFTATKAVVDFDLEIFKGEIRGIVGENGSGKSTLAYMIAGSLKPDNGNMLLHGKKYAPSSMLEARKKGISILVQEMGTINHLSVMDNIFLGKEDNFSRFGMISRKRMIQEAGKVLGEIEAADIDPKQSVDDLSFEDRKLLEVATAMYDKPDILILDETTTALSQKGREIIYRIIDKMKRDGKTVIFISHDLKELQNVCDNITVLRDGCLVRTLSKDAITIDGMRSLMIGRDLSSHYYREDLSCTCGEAVVLQVQGVSFGSIVKDVSFQLHKGEILGIGGLTECGMHELCKIIFGLIKPDTGKVTVLPSGNAITKASDSVRNRIAFIPKNREQEAMMPSASIKDNIVLMSYDKLKTGPFISPAKEIRFAKKQADLLQIKMVSIDQFCLFLSGGNKQKVVLSKWMANDSEILIMDCPTRGIDVGVKAAIYRLMEELKNSGKSILMVSEELPELLGMSDRIIILKDGMVSAIFQRGVDWNEEKVIRAMI